MKRLLPVFAIVSALFVVSQSNAQDFSNKGKDFWIAYTGHIDGTTSVMGLYLTGDQNASGSVQVGATNLPFTITAGQVTTLFIGPGSGGAASNLTVYNGQADGINIGGGIHVTSNKDIVVYAHIIKSARSGATLVLPKSVLGKEYIVPSYRNMGSSPGYGEIAVVAVEPATTIEITPTIPDRNNSHMAGIPFTVTLNNPGDVYQLQGRASEDFSGSVVKSISTGTGGCKPIAVFSSTTWSGFDCVNASGGDNLYQQLFPTKSWGKKFVTAPFINKPYDIVRIFVQNPSTVVQKTESGITAVLTSFFPAGNYYEFKTNRPTIIEADQPVSVVQYITSQTCGGGNSDPEMTLINPVEQTLDKITLFSAHQNYVPPGQTQVTTHYINVVIPTNKASTFLIDGALPTSGFSIIPNSGYSYLQENVTSSSAINPVHKLQADTGFTAIVYGYGNVESYGYNAGTNVRDLYQFVTVQNQYATVNYPSTCKNTPFYFSMTFPYQPAQIQWVFGAALNAQGIADVTVTNPVYDSTWVVNGKTLYRYKRPSPYIITAIGTYPIKVIAQNPSPDGCNGEQEINYDLEVFNKPVADFNFTASGCISDSVHFFNNPGTSGRPTIKWFWDFDDIGSGSANASSLENPAHLFMIQGSHNVAFSVVTDIGCLSDTVRKTVIISLPPIAKFGIAPPYCVTKTLTFTDSSSTISSGSIVKWTWNFGDGLPVVIATTNTSQSHTYAATGNYAVTLLVENASGCKSIVFSKTITVSANPIPAFTFGSACLPTGTMQFTNGSTISDGTQNAFIYTWNFGDGAVSAVKDPAHNYNSAGPFDVSLLVTSNAGCADSIKKSVNTIYAQPQAKFTAPAETCFGSAVNFTDQSSAANSSISGWQWNFGDGQTSTAQNPTHIYTAAGIYTVTLKATSPVGCTSNTYSLTITINALPTADFITGVTQCTGQSLTFTDASVPNSGNIVKWTWNFGDGSPVVIASTNTFQPHTYATTGNYTVSLQVETNKGCTSTITKQVTINPLPVVGFRTPDNCLTDPISTFTDTSSIADGSQAQFIYVWNFGDPNATSGNPNTSTIKNGKHKYSVAQSYNVKLTVTSNKGCSASTTQTFTINGAVPTSLFTVQGGLQRCSNDPVIITDNSIVDVGKLVKLEIYWDYTNNPTIKTTVTYPVAGANYPNSYTEFFTPASKNITVRLVAYSGDNCLHTSNQIITLKATPDINFPSIASICADKSAFQIAASAPNMTGGNGVFSGTGVSGSGVFNPQSAGAGTHLITYTYTGTNGCSNSKQQVIIVFPVPTVSAGPDKFILGGGTAVLNGTSTGSRPSFLWTPATWLNNVTIAQPVSTPLDDILYTLKVTTADGCSDSDQVFVKVLKAPTIPNVFTPNGDGTNDKWVIQYLESYPGATVEIFNRYGSLVYHSVGYTKPWDGTYNGKEMPAGTYYYIINPKNGRKQISGFVDIVR